MLIRLRDTLHETRTALRSLLQAVQAWVGGFAARRTRGDRPTEQPDMLRSQQRKLEVLHWIATRFQTDASSAEAIHALVDAVSQTTGFPIVSVESYDALRHVLTFVGAVGIPQRADRSPLEVPIAHTCAERVIQTRQRYSHTSALGPLKPYASHEAFAQCPIHTFVCIPLVIRDRAIGTLSLAHPEVCPVSEAEMQWLTCVAQYAALWLDSDRAKPQLQESAGPFHLEGSGMSGNIYEWDIPAGKVTRSLGLLEALGFSPTDVAPTPEWWLERVHPEDRLADDSFLAVDHFELEYRVRNRAEQYVTVLDRGLIVHDDHGAPLRMLGCVIDITLYKQVTEERDRFFELSADILCIVGLDGIFRRVSSACERILGYTPAEMVGVSCMNFIHPDDQASTHQSIEQALQTEWQTSIPKHHQCENRYRCKDGTYRWLQWSALVLVEQNIIFTVGRDVTDQKQAQAQLRDQEARLRSIFEQSTLGMTYISLDGVCIEVNQPFSDFFGYSLEEMRSLTLAAVTHADDRPGFEDAMARLRTGERSSFTRENRYLRKDGRTVWGKVTLSAICTEEGAVQFVAVILEDITDRKIADAALAESQKRYESLVHSINGIVWEFDLSTLLFTFVSDKAEQLLGYPVDQWKTEQGFWEAHIHPEDRPWVVPFCWKSTQMGEDHHFEYRMIAADGRTVWFEDVVSVVMVQGQPARLQGILIDVGDRKQVEMERQQAEILLSQQLQREQLLAEVTHHIRQSLDLNTILATAVNEVQHTLQADRALIYHLRADHLGQVIQESVREGLPSVLRHAWPDECFPRECYAFYLQGRPRIVLDVEADEWGSCLVEYSHEMWVKSKIVAPILQSVEPDGVKIWGLLVLHACVTHHTWQPADADLLQHIANQLAIAIQQSELYHQLQHANQNLEYLATHDKLTKIANRRFFEDICQRKWTRLLREQMPLSLIMADLDCFKQYNDTYGHPAGDECLLQVAQVIQSTLKRPGDLVARYGGEEFVVILPNTDVVGAISVVHAIQDRVRSLAIPHIHSFANPYITLSMGIATVIPQANLTLDHLIAAADAGLYQAKAQGRNGFAVAPTVTVDMLPLRQPKQSSTPHFS